MVHCDICHKDLKSAITSAHRKTKTHLDGLKAQGYTAGTDPTLVASVKPSKPRGTSSAGTGDGRVEALEQRVAALEDQIKYVISKLSSVDVKITPNGNNTVDYRSLSRVKPVIASMLQRGESISVDAIYHDSRLSQFPPAVVERAILDLIDDETFDASEGYSEYKVRGTIGRLIRR